MAKVVGSQKWVLSSDGRRLLRRALVAKDWGCAGVTFRREFLTPVVSGGQVGGRQAGVPLGKEKQANNVGRAKLKVQLLLLANREAVARSGWFWTGTFAEDVTDYAVASASWSAFVSRLRRRWPDVSWVCVPEIQEGRAAKYGVRVWHFHAAIWGVGVSHGSEFWPLWSAACGVNSRQLAERVRTPDALSSYVRKYVTKTSLLDVPVGRKCYFSGGRLLVRPCLVEYREGGDSPAPVPPGAVTYALTRKNDFLGFVTDYQFSTVVQSPPQEKGGGGFGGA